MKSRANIPRDVASEILFLSDRTCCVCRERGRPVQIHHLNGDPTNHKSDNLAVLCLDCHRDTQIEGGFDRKLDSSQIILYRKDWYGIVLRRRQDATTPPKPSFTTPPLNKVSNISTALVGFLQSLPMQKQAAYIQAQKGWDSGVTSDMMNASYGLVHNLQSYLIGLASFYPTGHFGPAPIDLYFKNIVQSRFDWHRAHLEPHGPGTGGAILDPITVGHVISDLDHMVIDMARSLSSQQDNFNFLGWLEEWGKG